MHIFIQFTNQHLFSRVLCQSNSAIHIIDNTIVLCEFETQVNVNARLSNNVAQSQVTALSIIGWQEGICLVDNEFLAAGGELPLEFAVTWKSVLSGTVIVLGFCRVHDLLENVRGNKNDIRIWKQFNGIFVISNQKSIIFVLQLNRLNKQKISMLTKMQIYI